MLIIDRFEGSFAVCEDENEKKTNISRDLLPQDAREGDVIFIENSVYSVDFEQTKKRREEALALLKRLGL